MDYVIAHPIVLLLLVALSAIGFVALVAIGLYYMREPREVVNAARNAGGVAWGPSGDAPEAGGGLAEGRMVALYDFEREGAFED